MAKIETLVDTFDTRLPFWTVSGGAPPVQWIDGRLRFEASAGFPSLNSGSMRWDLTDSFIFVHIEPPVNLDRQITLDLDNGSSDTDMVSIRVESSPRVVRCRIRTGGANSDTETLYDYVSMQWLRIRHDGTNVLWETAPTAHGPWAIVRSAPPPVFGINNRRVRFVSGAWSPPDPGNDYAWIDNLNYAPEVPSAAILTFANGAQWASAYAHGREIAGLWRAGVQFYESSSP